VEKGDLQTYLRNNKVDERQRVRWAIDVCEGLEHVHALGFVHRDVAARNILVASDLTAKVADFGLARETDDGNYYRSRSGQLPVRWSAPEALDDSKFSEASDVWSAGVLMFEIWTEGQTPYAEMNNQKVWVNVIQGYRLPKPALCSTDIYAYMRMCWREEPTERPTFGFLYERLTEYLRTVVDPNDLSEYLQIGDDAETIRLIPKRRDSEYVLQKRRLSQQNARRDSQGFWHNIMRTIGLERAAANPVYNDVHGHSGVNPLLEDQEYNHGANWTTIIGEEEPIYDAGHDGEGPVDRADVVHDDARRLRNESGWDEPNGVYDLGNEDDDAPGLYQGSEGIPLARPERHEVAEEEGFYGNQAENKAIKEDLLMANATEASAIQPTDVGQRCTVVGYESHGTIAFVGEHVSSGMTRIGVVLDKAEGINDGRVGGHVYFTCAPKHGVLVVPRKVRLL